MTTLFTVIGAVVTGLWLAIVLTLIGCGLWHRHELRAARRQRGRDLAEAFDRAVMGVVRPITACHRYGHAWTTCEEGDVRFCPRCEAVESVERR